LDEGEGDRIIEHNEKKKEERELILNEFIKKLMEKNTFTKEEFFVDKYNIKILLLCRLIEKGKIKENDEEFYEKIENLLKDIKDDIDGNIKKKKLEEFLNNDENFILQRMGLIKLLYDDYRPIEEFENLKSKINKINEDIEKLKNVKDNIIIYYKDLYKDLIKQLIEVIKDSQNKQIKQYKGETIKELIQKCDSLEGTINDIKSVENFLLFKVLYDKYNTNNDETQIFKKAKEELEKIGELLKKDNGINTFADDENYKDIIRVIKEKLSNNEEKAKEFISCFIEFYGIVNEELVKDLTILFKSKKYELDINSMIFFFECFEKNKKDSNFVLSEKYKNLSKKENNLIQIKNILKELKQNNIYDYQNIKNYNKLFTCLNEKKEAIDFLFSKKEQDIDNLENRIEPTNRTIKIKDIKDTKVCVSHINRMKTMSEKDRFDYIKNMEPQVISQFINYSKKYLAIIELDLYYDNSENIYELVKSKIKDVLILNIYQDKEDFLYYEEDKCKTITLEELIYLKNKIPPLQPKTDNDEFDLQDNNIIRTKHETLIFFKNIINNLEIIIKDMIILRSKGSSLPIKIRIKVEKMSKIKYELGEEEVSFKSIKNFLTNVKNNYISQLESIYKEKVNLRFLYGKQIRSVIEHLETSFNIDSFLRYILNKKDNIIKEGYKTIKRDAQDFINQYELYNKNSLESISMYITSLFENNETSLVEHYDNMRIKSSYTYKGIYLHKCENISMEEFIIDIFSDKIKELPVAQNMLITNTETSSEEIQSFFYRAILCNYNTLFVVELNDSFSESQYSIMNAYIDQLLSFKNKKYNEENMINVDKRKIQEYLDSCLVFVYEDEEKSKINSNKITSFLKEMDKFDTKVFQNDAFKKMNIKKNKCLNDTNFETSKLSKLGKIKNDNEKKFIPELDNIKVITSEICGLGKSGKIKNDNEKKFITELDNIKVITSEICGLGKSGKIRKDIEDNNKIYYHFTLGGILTKTIIFDKLKNLLNKIKKENYNYKAAAIHLDLSESEEKSVINEFLFSFLITKFYSNNESIIYIPKEISIYIEIPNCFDSYLEKFSILKKFKRENISIKNMPEFNLSTKIINIFNRMLRINSNEAIENYVRKHIGIKNCSYHQIDIFIKLFISQYNKFEGQLEFWHGKENVTNECIEEFAKCTQYFTNGGFAKLLTGEIKKEKTNYIDNLTDIYDNDLNNKKFLYPLIFTIREKMTYEKFIIPTYDSQEYKSSKEYLNRLKEILDLPNQVENDIKINGEVQYSLISIIEEKENNYVITNDNFRKMALLLYRIKANVPVIIMGETGCGKTALITKLNQILNNGHKKIETINIHPGINDEKLCEIMEKKDEKAKIQENQELWLFFDEINTCPSLSLITEIFIKRTYNGNKISDNIRLIGACNPYRRIKGNKEKCGLSFPDDDENDLVYLVNPLPQSLLYYVFSFGALDEKDEEKYIYNIIANLFDEKEEKSLHKMTTKAISKCHIYLRKTFDYSVVSLREIARFPKLVRFFQDYFEKKNKFENKNANKNNDKIRSIICSIYLCYYIRLTSDMIRRNFEVELRPIFFELINNEKTEEKNGNLIDQIKNEQFRNEIRIRSEDIKKFGDFIKIEEDYLFEQVKPEKGIGKNSLLKENLFLLFVSLITNIPLIIIGKPGTGKSLSVQLINRCMKGKYSDKGFFKLFPKVVQTYFQGSDSTKPEDVEILFDKAKKKYKKIKEKNLDLPISEALFDELGLAERSKFKPLKAMHSELDYAGKNEGISFIGLSNYSLDAAKLNRALVSSVPDLDQKVDELINTAQNIVESISPKIKNDKVFEILSHTYYEYKKKLDFINKLIVYKDYYKIYICSNVNQMDENNNFDIQDESNSTNSENNIPQYNENIGGQNKIKKMNKETFESIVRKKEFKTLMKKYSKIRKDFHGNRDFYNLIKGTAFDLGKSAEFNDNEKVERITKYIERNFGGIEYEIDIDFNLILDDIREEMDLIKGIIEGYSLENQDKAIKLNSVYLFKKLYNLKCDAMKETNLKIEESKLNDYNLNKCINDNIKDNNSRFLLMEIKQSLASLIYENIKLQNPFKEKTKLYDGSPFPDDNNNEYRFKKINDIQEDAKDDKLIIIENLNQIHPFLFDLYNMNYELIDDEKYAKICLDSFKELKTLVNDKFRIIIIVDKNFVNQCDLAFLNRLEKMIVSFDKLLDSELKYISNEIIKDIDLKNIIKEYKETNYSLKNLLINCGDQEIQGLIYYFSKVSKKYMNEFDEEEEKKEKLDLNKLKENVIDKIYKILPQDIIAVLPSNNIIKKKYEYSKDIYNFKDYVDYLKKEENRKYKLSIIYTFTSLSNTFKKYNKDMSFMITEVRSENDFKNLIEEKKKNNDNNKLEIEKDNCICIQFNQSNSKNIKFISNFILNNFKDDKYNYIIIIHINRNFNNKRNERIYLLPDINPDIHQIFIDNLDGDNKITLKELFKKGIKTIINDHKEDLNLISEFDKILEIFLNEKLEEKSFDNDDKKEYIKEIKMFLDEQKLIKEKLFDLIYKSIEDDDNKENCSYLIEKIYEDKLINPFTIDIVSCVIEYIKKEILFTNFKKIFEILEDNNILTTLIEIEKNQSISQNIVEKILIKYFNEMTIDNNYICNCKFLFNYNVPGFYNFFEFISNYINKNIVLYYIAHENTIRTMLNEDNKKLNDFHDAEESLVNNLYNEIANNHKFIFEIMCFIPNNLIFQDYITYYLQRYRNNIDIYYKDYYKDDIYHKIIELLLQIRFTSENKIIKSQNNISIFLLKIIWIESNVNYILNILKIINEIRIMCNFNQNENELYQKIENIYSRNNIKYITNKERNPEITKEVSQCYYILLAIICYFITSDEIQLKYNDIEYNNGIQIEINYYCKKLIEINKILQILNDDLYIFLNEMYIIDELIKVIELLKKNCGCDKINKIKKYIRENAQIIQRYSNDNDRNYMSDELINNFELMYELLISEEDLFNKDEDNFDKLRYILFKEIQKISDINYRQKILKKVLEQDKMIKKSNDIFQMLFKNYLRQNNFKKIIKNISIEDDIIIKLIEKKLNDNIVLEETILYLFEKNSLIYFNGILNKKSKSVFLEDEPLEILKECLKYIGNYLKNQNESKIKAKEICKIFCLAYIKTFCYTFIKMSGDDKSKVDDPIKIIEVLNTDNTINKMIRLYIYKILYNKYNIDFFLDETNIIKYKLDKYIDFNNYIKINDLSNIYKINYRIETIKKNNYKNLSDTIEKYKKEKFGGNIRIKDFDIKKYGIDNFYIASFNSILSNSLIQSSEINKNFYNKVCKELFKGKTLKAIELFYDPQKFKDFKKNNHINSNNIKPLLFSYRYCLNELFNEKGIYYPLYDKQNLSFLKEKFYPGNDTKFNSVYFDIINHFKTKPKKVVMSAYVKIGFIILFLLAFLEKES